MNSLEKYLAYFDTAYPRYGDHAYSEICNLVSGLPPITEMEELLGRESVQKALEFIKPIIKIKNYKSQTPAPENPYATALILAKLKDSATTEPFSTEHIEQFNALLGMRGFQLPTVSAALHFCHPKIYPIVDRNIEAACGLLANEFPAELGDNPPSLPASTTSNKNKLVKYKAFISFLGKAIEIHNQQHNTQYEYRQLDKALMVYGVESYRIAAENANK